MKDRMRIVFMGTPEFAVASLEALCRNGHNIVGVVTVPDKPAGRGKKLQMSAVKKYALENELPVLTPLKLKSNDFLDTLREWKADLQIVVAFRMLPEVVWSMPKRGTFNLHGSLLPQYRGAAPINHAIINGESQTGVTTFFLDHEIDTGRIIDRRTCIIEEEDTAGVLHDRLMKIGAQLVIDTASKIEIGNVSTQEQNELLGAIKLNHAPKIYKEDGLLDWNHKAAVLHNKIRGLSPYPASWTWVKGFANGKAMSMKIYAVEKTNIKSEHPVGSITIINGKEILVHTLDYCLKVLELQLQGKKRMKTQDFLRGFSFTENMCFSN